MNRGFRADSARSRGVIEGIAREVRQVVLPDEPLTACLPGWQLFERLGRYRVQLPDGQSASLDYQVKRLPRGCEAYTRYEAETGKVVITLSEDTYEGLEQGRGRPRFTLAHEIGHAALHSDELFRLSSIPHAVGAMARGALKGHAPFWDCEWQANSFAAALLMPARGIRSLGGVGDPRLRAKVERAYNVSSDAARVRVSVYRRDTDRLLTERRY